MTFTFSMGRPPKTPKSTRSPSTPLNMSELEGTFGQRGGASSEETLFFCSQFSVVSSLETNCMLIGDYWS